MCNLHVQTCLVQIAGRIICYVPDRKTYFMASPQHTLLNCGFVLWIDGKKYLFCRGKKASQSLLLYLCIPKWNKWY